MKDFFRADFTILMNTVNIEQELRVESCEKFASTCNS